jgi:virulence factor Mce-like protein
VLKRILPRLLVVAALVLGLGGCTPIGEDRLRATALLEDSSGLFVGNDVGILGVPVGKITDITPHGEVVRVDFQVSGVSVPADVGAVVVARSVATDRYLELTPADGPGPRLEDGATIPLERTRTPAEFDEVLASLKQLSEGLRGPRGDAAGLRSLLRNGAEALDGRGGDLRDTVRQLSGAMESLSEHRGDLTGTIRALDGLTAAVAANEHVIDEFAVSVSDATNLFADESQEFARALDSLTRALRTLARFARDHRGALRGSLGDLTWTLDQLLEHQRSLAESIEVLPLTLQNTGMAISGDDRLNVRLPPEHISPRQELTGPLCDELPANACDRLGADPRLGDLLGVTTGGPR